jgi:probable F420-dependent oxidoreductase
MRPFRFAVQTSTAPDGRAWRERARKMESLGYSTLYIPDHFGDQFGPLVALTSAAEATESLRVGSLVFDNDYRHPVVLAKELATLDVLSGGRLDVGVGIGWSRDEYEAAGAPSTRRGARADEFLRVLSAVWGEDPVEFAGEFFRVPRALIQPKPVQRPRPRLLVGGYTDAVLRRAATLGDGYTGGNIPLADLAKLVARVRAAARDAGRDPATFPIVCRGAYRLTPSPLGSGRRTLHGCAEEIRDDVRRYGEAGVGELFLDPNFQPSGGDIGTVLAHMEALAPQT